MAENHELRITIDAGAAERGSRQFVAAVEAVKKSVRDLERDSTGTFKKLVRNLKDAEAASKVKMGIDKTTLNTLEKYAKVQQQALQATMATRKESLKLRDVVRGLSEAYMHGRTNVEGMNKALLQSNAHLKRQIQLASQARSAVRQIRSAPAIETAITPRQQSGARGAGAAASGQAKINKALEHNESLQNRITRAIDNQRAATVSLMSQLAKVGGVSEVEALEKAFIRFRSELNSGSASAKTLDDAQTRLNHVQKTMKVVLTRLNAELREQREDLKAAATAAREQTKAFDAMARAARSAQSAESSRAKEMERMERVQTSTNKAMRSAELQTVRLSERMRALGDTSGINRINAALKTLQRELENGVSSQQALRNAQQGFEAAATKAAVAITRKESAQRRATQEANRMAQAERRVRDEAIQIERQMRSLAGATNATSQAWHRATGNLRGMENAFNTTYQAGTLFRNMIGAFTLGTFIRSVYEAGNSLQQFMVTMEVATGDIKGAMENALFIDDLTSNFGTNLRTAREDYAKFAVAAELAGVSAQQSRDIFDSVSMAMSVMGRGAEDQRLAFLALEQMMSKGTVSSEELRRQLGERLPGAVNMMADALSVTTAELQNMLKAGEISSADALPKFAKEIQKNFGPGLQSSLGRASRNIGTFMNEIEKALSTAANSGFMDTLAIEFAELTKIMRSGEVIQIAQEMGMQLARMAEIGGNALGWLIENADLARRAVIALLAGLVLNKVVHFANFFVTAGQQLAAFAVSMRGTKTANDLTTISTDAYTAALARNTTAVGTNAAAQATLGANLTSVQAQQRLRAAFLGTTEGLDGLGRGAERSRRGVAGVAAGLGVLSRGLTVVAPVLGIVATGLLMLPGFMNAFSDSVVQADADVQRAIKRSGVAFDALGDTLGNFSQNVVLNNLISDIEALRDAVTDLNGASIKSFASMMHVMNGGDGMGLGSKMYRGIMDSTKGFELGKYNEAWNQMDSAAQGAARSVAQVMIEMKRGGKDAPSAFEVHEKLVKAMRENPSGRSFYKAMEADLKDYMMAEQALLAQREKMVVMLGSVADKDLSKLADLGASFISSGDEKNLDAYKERLKELRDTYAEMPDVVARLDTLDDFFERMSREGASAFDFKSEVIGLFDSYVKGAEAASTAEQKARAANAAVNDTIQEQIRLLNLRNEKASWTSLRMGGVVSPEDRIRNLPDVDTSAIASVQGLFDGFGANSGVKVIEQDMNDLLSTMMNLSPEMANLSYKAAEQFTTLDAGSQTYRTFDAILARLAQTSPELAGSIELIRMATATLAKEQDDTAMTAYALRQALLEYASALPPDVAQSLLDAADALGESGLALSEASRDMADAARGADDVDAAAQELLKTLEAMRALGKGIVEEAIGDITDVQFETELSKIAPWLREGAELFREGMEQLDADLSAKLEANEGDPKAIRAITDAYEENVQALREVVRLRDEAEKAQFDTQTWEDAQKEMEKLRKEAEKAREALRDLWGEVADYGKGIQQNVVALELFTSGQVHSREAAEFLAKIMAEGNAELTAAAQNMIAASRSAELYAESLERLADVKEDTKDFAQSALEEYHAMKLLASGAASSSEGANLLARAMMTGDAATIAQTQSIVSQVDALDKLKERMETIKGLNDALTERSKSAYENNLALTLMIEGEAKSIESAEALAAAIMTGDQALIEKTRSMNDMADAAEELGKKLKVLAADPVKEWVDSVPTWLEAGRQIEVGVFESLSDELANMIKTGEFSFERLADSILGTVADIVADMAVRELMGLFGMDGSGDGKAGFGLGEKLQSTFGYSKGSMFDPANGGMPQPDSQALIAEGEQSGMVMSNAVVAGGEHAAQALQAALQQGGQGAATDLQQAIQQATEIANPKLAEGMTTAADLAADKLNSGMSSGGETAAERIYNAITAGGDALAGTLSSRLEGTAGFGTGFTPTGGTFGSGLSGQSYGSGFTGTGGASTLYSAAAATASGDAFMAGVIETAQSIEMNPRTLLSIIGYESGGTFDPGKWGGAGGNYQGLIQFGPEERRTYGVQPTLESQLGADGAIARFFKDRGWHSGLDNADARAYATVNGGNPYALGASDANNGGRPGTVAWKWDSDPVMQQHKAKADQMLSQYQVSTNDAARAANGLTGALNEGATPALGDFSSGLGQSAPQLTSFGTGLEGAQAPLSDFSTNLGSTATAVDFSQMGPKRPNMPNTDIVQAVQSAVQDTFGDGMKVVVQSGMGEHGSARHRGGHAMDFQLMDSNGQLVQIDSAASQEFVMNAARRGVTGFGAGSEYMGDTTYHMDNYPLDRYTGGMGRAWGSVGNRWEDQFVAAGQGQMGSPMGMGGIDLQQQMIQGGQAAGQALTTAMQTGGQTAGTQITTGMQTGGTVAGTQMNSGMMTGGMMAGSQMTNGIGTGGQTAAMQMENAIVSGGSQAATQMGAAAGSGGGGGGGGLLGGLGDGGIGAMLLSAGLSMLPQLFGGKDDDDDEKNEYTIVLPDEDETGTVVSYSQGTANTSGIPAMLHQNEAVIPLTGNRKVPVELDGAQGGGTVINQTFNISTPDADSFRKSQKQIAAGAAATGQRAMKSNG